MSTSFPIRSSDQALLTKATRVADEFARPYAREGIVGIVFLGAIARGYFDPAADIDIALFRSPASNVEIPQKFLKVEGLEIHCWLSNYEDELAAGWDMAKRWTFSEARIYHDPAGAVARLLADKVALRPEEKKWLLMSGLTLSEWYANRLTLLWVERGNLISAHHMFGQGLNYFFDMLFGLNDELVPDMKWRYYCAERLARLPSGFAERIAEIMTLHALSVAELERRREAFMGMWREMQPIVEDEVGMSFDEMVEIV